MFQRNKRSAVGAEIEQSDAQNGHGLAGTSEAETPARPDAAVQRRDPLAKGLALLRLMLERPAERRGVREIAAALELPVGTAHRLLAALCEAGFLEQAPELGRYGLSLDLFRLASAAAARMPLRELAYPHLRALTEAVKETAFLTLYDRGRQEIVIVESVPSPHALRYVVELNSWMPVHAGASGLSILAFLPKAERQAIIARTRLAPLTERTITDTGRLKTELRRIRRQGYACTRGQRIPGAVGLAAPIFGPAGEVMGNIGVTIPEQRFRSDDEAAIAQRIVSGAAALSQALGAPGAAMTQEGRG
jgi:DNA-binding IclR family transcriptional regulator